MTDLQICHVLAVLSAILALNCVSTLPRDVIFPTADENLLENLESVAYPPSMNDQPLKVFDEEDKPKSCFHFYVSRNMSSLLAEATKMLRTIRDRREREWILTFIYRIKSLAEHLRAHPDSRNYDCLPTDEEAKKRILSDNMKGQQQPELYFIDDVPKRSNEGEDNSEKADDENSSDNQEPNNTPATEEQSIPDASLKTESDFKPSSMKILTESSAEIPADNTLTESSNGQKEISTLKQDVADRSEIQESSQKLDDNHSLDKKEQSDDSSLILSSVPDCNSNLECINGQDSSSSQVSSENYFADAGNIYPLYQSDDTRKQDFEAAERRHQEVLKETIRKAILEEFAPEMKKFKTVGGTEEDLTNLWNSVHVDEVKSNEENERVDFDYEETGAAAGDLNMNERVQPDRTVAPSLDEVQNSKENSNNGKDESYEPYDDSDVLVQQLFDVRYNEPPSKTTKSLNDQNNEYLITSFVYCC